jgi:hypothetical protein
LACVHHKSGVMTVSGSTVSGGDDFTSLGIVSDAFGGNDRTNLLLTTLRTLGCRLVGDGYPLKLQLVECEAGAAAWLADDLHGGVVMLEPAGCISRVPESPAVAGLSGWLPQRAAVGERGAGGRRRERRRH